jgi:hypothetical protein
MNAARCAAGTIGHRKSRGVKFLKGLSSAARGGWFDQVNKYRAAVEGCWGNDDSRLIARDSQAQEALYTFPKRDHRSQVEGSWSTDCCC